MLIRVELVLGPTSMQKQAKIFCTSPVNEMSTLIKKKGKKSIHIGERKQKKKKPIICS
jgi:hypothetical protein